MHLTISILAGLLSLSPVSSKILSKKITKAPSGWTLSSSTESTHRFTLTVALTHQNETQFYSRLNSISDPASVRYGEWLEKEDVDSILKPAAASKATVLSWLKNAGIQQVQSDDYFVHLNTDVATANKLLGARYQHYEQNGVRKLRTLEYSIDDTVADHIALVHPTTFFGNTKAFQPIAHFQQFQDPELEARAPKLSPSCKSLITPACVSYGHCLVFDSL